MTDNNNVQLLQLTNIPKDNFIYPFSTHLKNRYALINKCIFVNIYLKTFF